MRTSSPLQSRMNRDFVIPAKAGIQTDSDAGADAARIPAFAGMMVE